MKKEIKTGRSVGGFLTHVASGVNPQNSLCGLVQHGLVLNTRAKKVTCKMCQRMALELQ